MPFVPSAVNLQKPELSWTELVIIFLNFFQIQRKLKMTQAGNLNQKLDQDIGRSLRELIQRAELPVPLYS